MKTDARKKGLIADLHGGVVRLLTNTVSVGFFAIQVGLAHAAPTLENYEFLPVPAMVNLGTSLTLTMAGYVDPGATASVPSCPVPTMLADQVNAEAGTLRQTSPATFVYTAPAVMPSHPMVGIRASYKQPFAHDVQGMVILVDPRLASTTTGTKSGSSKPGPRKGGQYFPKYFRYAGFVQVFAMLPSQPETWQRNQFWLESDDDTRKSYGTEGGDGFLTVNFKRLVGHMSAVSYDLSHQHLVFSEGEEVFNGEDEVFSFLTLDLTKQRYGWQAHGEKLGGRPPSSTTYSDPGYNSSCGHVNFSMGKQATLPYSDLATLSGTLDCTNVVEGGSGVIMKWNFIPIF